MLLCNYCCSTPELTAFKAHCLWIVKNQTVECLMVLLCRCHQSLWLVFALCISIFKYRPKRFVKMKEMLVKPNFAMYELLKDKRSNTASWTTGSNYRKVIMSSFNLRCIVSYTFIPSNSSALPLVVVYSALIYKSMLTEHSNSLKY